MQKAETTIVANVVVNLIGVKTMDDKCCGTCKHHYYDEINEDWVCINSYSKYGTYWTEYKDSCEEWEGRD